MFSVKKEATSLHVPGLLGSFYLGGGRLDQVESLVSFAELVVAGRGVGKDLNSIQTHLNMWAEETSQHSVIQS